MLGLILLLVFKVCSSIDETEECCLWGSWSPCTKTCVAATRTRYRFCTIPTAAAKLVKSEPLCPISETVSCSTTVLCPVNEGWGSWVSWTQCTKTCGGGTRTRYRPCNNPTPANGGLPCPGSRYETVSCSTIVLCPDQPTTSPTITQTQDGPIIEGNKITLTCTIQGGNPVATITWSCDGATQIIPTGSPCTEDAISSVELVTSRNNDGQICKCTGRHILWTDDKIQQHTITVYYEPTSSPSILQTPSGPINESSTVILTCDIKGGNPLATITWTCEGSSPINPTGSPPTNTAISSVQLTVNSNNNGRICTCVGHHTVWTIDKTTSHTLDVRLNGDWGSWVSWAQCTKTCVGGTRTRYRPCNDPTPANGGSPCPGLRYETVSCSTTILCPYQPTTSPTITQTPVGTIIEGDKLTLTCTIQGGNPVATITWSCDGATQIIPTGSPCTEDAISSVELVTSKNNNGQICNCTGRHLLWTDDKIQQHTITVYYEPTSFPSILQIPSGPINESSTVILTCDIKGGNPLATITWTCEGSSPINPTGSPPTNTAISSVQLTVNSNNNGRICTCVGHHTVWTIDNTTSHTLDVRYKPTAPTFFYVVCKTTSAVVLWRSEFNGGSKQKFYVEYWRISHSSSSMLSPTIPDPGVGADLQYTVNNLVPETIYMFQIIARNVYGDSLSKSVKCTTGQIQRYTNPTPISQDSNGLFAGGISSLIIGLISIIFSVSFVFLCRSRLQKREKMRTNDYTEFTACTHCNPVVKDSYDSLTTTAIGPADINETQTDRNINTYEECLPVTNVDDTYNSLNKQLKEKKKLKKNEEIYDNMKI